MEVTYPTKAIILKRESWHEYDSRVVVYTRERGKLELVARGTKKIKSKLAGHLEPLCFSDIMVVKGRQFDYIGSAVSISSQENIKSDLDKIIVVGKSVNIFNTLVKENFKDQQLFLLLESYLEVINLKRIKYNKILTLSDFFIFKLLILLGYKPELYKCTVCKRRITPGDNQFNFKKGGITCEKCIKRQGSSNNLTKIADNCIKILRLSVAENLDKLSKINIKVKEEKELNYIINSLVNYL